MGDGQDEWVGKAAAAAAAMAAKVAAEVVTGGFAHQLKDNPG